MSSYDFDRCTPLEFDAIYNAWRSQREEDMKSDWERMRLTVSFLLQPHSKKKIEPDKILKFPWDVEEQNKKPLPTKEEARMRFESLLQRSEYNGTNDCYEIQSQYNNR